MRLSLASLYNGGAGISAVGAESSGGGAGSDHVGPTPQPMHVPAKTVEIVMKEIEERRNSTSSLAAVGPEQHDDVLEATGI